MSPTSYPVVQAQPVAPENLPFWAKCQEALEQSASSRFIPTAYLLAIRSIISVLLTAHVILFFISGEYRLNQLQGLSALVLAISSILLVVASLISLVGSFPGRSAFISTFLLIIPLLQGSLTVSIFASVIRFSLNTPKMPWKYSLIAAIILDPLCGIFLVLSSQTLKFNHIHSITPLIILFAFHSIAAMKWKSMGSIVAQHMDYSSTSEKQQIIAHLVVVIVSFSSAALTLALAYIHHICSWCSWCTNRKKYDEFGNNTPQEMQSSDPDVDVENKSSDRRMNMLGVANRPDRGTRTLRISNGSTRSNLPWFSRSDFSLDEPEDWVHVESEYGSRTLDEDAVTRINTN